MHHLQKYMVKPGTKVRLREWKTKDSGHPPDDKVLEKEFARLNAQLRQLHDVLYAEHKHKVLIILQAMDSGGKDGTVSHVFGGLNPQGVAVHSFKTPSAQELDHDYLWRVHAQVPAKGEIGIFNRSHYEDVVIVRVHDLVPAQVWRKRFDHINAFERMLADEGTVILKFFLHISDEEQRKRLRKRLEDPRKIWKFNVQDITERKHWPEYMKAYGEAISLTSTAWAPWHIVPADAKWSRNLAVSRLMIARLKELKMAYPKTLLKLGEKKRLSRLLS